MSIPGVIGLFGGPLGVVPSALGKAVGVNIPGGLIGDLLGLKPKKKQAAHAEERLYASFDLHAPLKIVFGHGAMATDIRYQAYTGTDQDHIDQILAVAGHECESIDELWFDTIKVWTSGGGVVAAYSSYLTVAVRNPGTAANGIAIDSTWTAACTLIGCAYLHLRYKRAGASKKAASPFANSIPSRVTVIGKGAKVPDLRVSGVDIDDQTTWVYDDAGSESGRIPAYQRLFYLRGWQIEGKLALGRGIPAARLDLPSYDDAANICDEDVALDAGGTEKRYRADMVWSEAEAPANVLGKINETMNAVPTDELGKIGVYVLHDDLSDPDMLELSDDDLAGPIGGGEADESWLPHLPIEQTRNVIRGHYTDATPEGLYQAKEAPELALPGADLGSPDGIQRIDSFDLEPVQSATQWMRLAKLREQRRLRPGLYTANFKPARAWLARMQRPILFRHRGMSGFGDGRFMRVRNMTMPTAIGGAIRLTLQVTEAEEFDWDKTVDEQAVEPSVAPPPWEWENDPTLGTLLGVSSHIDETTGQLDSPLALPAIVSANVGYRFTGVITWNATAGTPATGTVSVGAGDLLMGDTPVSYGGMSAGVSGTNGVSTVFQLYAFDPLLAGGTVTLLATDDPDDVFDANGNVWFGAVKVDFPAAGSDSGTGEAGGGTGLGGLPEPI